MIDTTGVEWLPVEEAARQVRVRVETIRVWVCRGRVRAYGSGAGKFIHMPDVMDAEHAWRVRLADRTTSV